MKLTQKVLRPRLKIEIVLSKLKERPYLSLLPVPMHHKDLEMVLLRN